VLALGCARVYRDGHEIPFSCWKYARTREMFYFLLSHPPCTKEQIGRALWPDASPAQLHDDFRVALFYLRHALGRPDWICFENERYNFNRALPCWYDVAVFEKRIAEGRRCVAERQPESAMGPLRAAIELYHGEFLEGWNAGEWCLRQREELEREYLDALLVLGRLYGERGRYEGAMELYRKAIAVDEYLEAAHRELMRCYARMGEYGEAARHYQQFNSLVHSELGVPLSPETQALYAELMKGRPV
jgi:DNA-binding SARP family transcriptional activator